MITFPLLELSPRLLCRQCVNSVRGAFSYPSGAGIAESPIPAIRRHHLKCSAISEDRPPLSRVSACPCSNPLPAPWPRQYMLARPSSPAGGAIGSLFNPESCLLALISANRDREATKDCGSGATRLHSACKISWQEFTKIKAHLFLLYTGESATHGCAPDYHVCTRTYFLAKLPERGVYHQ